MDDFRTDRRAGGDGFTLREKLLRRVQPEKDLGAEATRQHVGAAGTGVRIVNEGFQAELVAGVNRRQRGEAAHAKHRIRAEAAQKRLATTDGAPGFPQKRQHPRRERRRFRHGGHCFEAQVRVFRRGFGIHLLFGNEQHDLVTARAQGFCHGDSGKQVAARATTGDDDFQRFGHGRESEQPAGNAQNQNPAFLRRDLNIS